MFLLTVVVYPQQPSKLAFKKFPADTTKFPEPVIMDPVLASIDSLEASGAFNFKAFKKKVHASYYHDKFNGRKTASGTKFNNNKYTCAHRKFPFGTKLRITNEVNGKCVIVEVTDRGPFSKAREIDITKRAFMDIAHNKGSGGVSVTIEEVVAAVK